GDPPLRFRAVMQASPDATNGVRLLSAHGLTYYHLEVKPPTGATFVVTQPVPPPASVPPPFRFQTLPPGMRLGQELGWNPAGRGIAWASNDWRTAARRPRRRGSPRSAPPRTPTAGNSTWAR